VCDGLTPSAASQGTAAAVGAAPQRLLLHPDDLHLYTKLHRGRVTQRQVSAEGSESQVGSTRQRGLQGMYTEVTTLLCLVGEPAIGYVLLQSRRTAQLHRESFCVLRTVWAFLHMSVPLLCFLPQALAAPAPWPALRLALEVMFEGVEGAGTLPVTGVTPRSPSPGAAAAELEGGKPQGLQAEPAGDTVQQGKRSSDGGSAGAGKSLSPPADQGQAVCVGDLVTVTYKPANPRWGWASVT
jgi:hypothetical protein